MAEHWHALEYCCCPHLATSTEGQDCAHHFCQAAIGLPPPPVPLDLLPACCATAGAAAAVAAVRRLHEVRCCCVGLPSKPRCMGCLAARRSRCCCASLLAIGHAAMTDTGAPRGTDGEGLPRRFAVRAAGKWNIMTQIPQEAGADHMHAELVGVLMAAMMLWLAVQAGSLLASRRGTSSNATLSEQVLPGIFPRCFDAADTCRCSQNSISYQPC